MMVEGAVFHHQEAPVRVGLVFETCNQWPGLQPWPWHGALHVGVVKVSSAMGVSTGLLSITGCSGSGKSSSVAKMSDNIMMVFPVPEV